ncbi:hypothetical protein JVT61DRAFT_11060 [Boletus reticuloceps]|uniref:Uncharacterized protein n=1 Tax=Boletus reticuloceps TaxID=495285 RepID=A0A8I3A540_9AGAM|nr:hypothetical protein JVT61DRAFT_11060 [Boletus reticuloceps]
MWWDAFNVHLEAGSDDELINIKCMILHLDDETTGNFALWLTKSELIQKTRYEMITKVTKLVLQDNIGYIQPDVALPPVIKALKDLVKAIIMDTEKHIIHVEFPGQDISKDIYEKSNVAKEKLEQEMPEELSKLYFDSKTVETYWAPADKDYQKALANISVVNHNDFVKWNYKKDNIQALEERKKLLDKGMQSIALCTNKDCTKLAGMSNAVNKALKKHKGKSC